MRQKNNKPDTKRRTTPKHDELERQMRIARKGIHKYRRALQALSK